MSLRHHKRWKRYEKGQPGYRLLDRDGISDKIHLFNDKLREWEDYYNYHRLTGRCRVGPRMND